MEEKIITIFNQLYDHNITGRKCYEGEHCGTWDTYFFFSFFVSFENLFTHMETSPWLGKINKFDLYSALMAIEYWGLNSWACHTYTPTVTRAIRLKWSSPRTRDTHTCCRTFSSVAVTTRFHDFFCRGRESKTKTTGRTILPSASPAAAAFVLV